MYTGQALSIIPNLNLNMDQYAQNPYEADMQEQVQLQQMFTHTQRTGTEKINEAFLGFAEEQRETNKVMAEQLKLLGQKLVTHEAEAKLQHDVLLEVIKKLGEANSLLLKELDELKSNFNNHTHLPRNEILTEKQSLVIRSFPEEPSRTPIAIPDAVYIRAGDYFKPGLKKISQRDVTCKSECIIS